tara:strand:+ start:581 stop:1171 length:591 start_codon:yes stop_codon:yes gene_type:complete
MSFVPSANISFFHIPKTGGNTVTSILKDTGLALFNVGHTTYKEIFDNIVPHNGQWPNNYRDIILNSHKVAIVRHPYYRIRSYYSFLKRNQHFHGIGNITFDEFLFDTSDEVRKQRAWWSQTEYTFVNGVNGMDQIIYFDNFVEDLSKVFSDRGVKVDFSRKHNLKSNSDQVAITEKQKEFLYEKYEEDFINFNFKG